MFYTTNYNWSKGGKDKRNYTNILWKYLCKINILYAKIDKSLVFNGVVFV